MKELKERHSAVIKTGLLVGLVLTILTSALSVSRAVGGQQTASTTARSNDAELVMLPVAVCDKKGSCAKGLSQDAFTVLSDKAAQQIEFFSNQDEPASIAILIDMSGSMLDKRPGVNSLGFSRTALTSLMQSGNRANEYLLLSFNQNARLLDWTRDKQVMLATLDKLTSDPPKGRTALFDVCHLVLEKAKSRAFARRALILFTDGQDSSSQHNFIELRRFLSTSQAVIYAISPVDRSSEYLGSLDRQGNSILEELASLSGGLVFHPKSKAEMDAAFEFISQDLRHQYLIGFKPKDVARDGKPHNITVKVTLPPDSPLDQKHLLVRSRKSHVALKQ